MDNSQTILFIVTKSVWGGAQKYIYDLARSLRLKGFRVGIAAGGAGALADKIRASNIPYREISSLQRDIAFLKEISAGIEIMRFLLKIRPRIIHASSPKAAGIAGMAAFLCMLITFFHYRPRMIMTVHGWTFHESRPAWQRFFIRFLSRVTALFYHHVIVISRADYHAALRYHITSWHKLALIPLGINTDDYSFLSRDEARALFPNHMRAAPFLVGTIGEWTANKNYAALIEAASIIVKKNPEARFVLFGWGEQKQLLSDLIKTHNLDHHIALVEGVYDAARFLKAFDVFVLPSLKEGLPYVLLEAQCAGIPIVATAVGGIPEIINETNGILVTPNRSDLLADAILSINRVSPSKRHEQNNSLRTLDDMLADTIHCYVI